MGASAAQPDGGAKERPGRVEGFKVRYENGDETEWRGQAVGTEVTFELDTGEYITHVWYAADEGAVQRLLFGTTNGRRSQWFGSEHGHFWLLHDPSP